MQRKLIATTIAAVLLSFGAHAQNAASETARDTDQQKRIEQGLQSGQLSTKEAAGLERQERRIDATEARDMKDGKLSAGEKAQIQREQNRASAAITKDKHNAVTGNPNSVSSQRMQADVQRNVNQEARIHQGVRSGELSNKEVGSLERGQAHVDRAEARAGANGHVGAGEQARIQGRENRQSARIHNKKHNDTLRATTP
ncbi:MAG: hypothetical protein JSS42_13700 [Proteobacteria bacterium]|uniref:hypothetical protein n=1 Tax=Rudaea sp. TaxID=2136325 RepID=UPI00321FCB2A|nr:hypothetical protein [Pseudomonadota bacterium]